VQPYANQPFTRIHGDTWNSATHPGVEYAALLVGPDFLPPPITNVLPSTGILGLAITKGTPPVWQRWWFLSACAALILSAVYGFHRHRMHQMAQTLNERFEERLAERTRVAQILHDTLLQGVVSASMQLHVAVDQLPADSPAMSPLRHVQESMTQVVEEGRNTLRGLQSTNDGFQNLQEYFSQLPRELNVSGRVEVTVQGPVLPIRPSILAEIYTLGRDLIGIALRGSPAPDVKVKLRYTASEFRVIVHTNGIDREMLRTTGLFERAGNIGARVVVRKRLLGGEAIQVRIPGQLVFETSPSPSASGSFAALLRRGAASRERE